MKKERTLAVILAGGLGNRMGASLDIPKQFFRLTDKPLIVHTLEIFQKHPEIDAVCVVCLESWNAYLRGCLENFGIDKVKWIVTGGQTRHESVHNGLSAIKDFADKNDIIVIHDGVRPFIKPETISSSIQAVKEHGSAMTSIRSSDSLLISEDSVTSTQAVDRNSVFLVQTPQSYRYDRGLSAYEEAHAKGISNSINCCELFVSLGQSVHLIPGLKTNIKLTTAEDIDFLYALHALYCQEGTEKC